MKCPLKKKCWQLTYTYEREKEKEKKRRREREREGGKKMRRNGRGERTGRLKRMSTAQIHTIGL